MLKNTGWKNKFEQEMETAEQARAAENEGMARVCARRAAGVIISEYLQRQGLPMGSASAYDLLRYLKNLPGLNARTAQAVEHLLVRITPEHTLPVEADLIAEARWLAFELLGEA